LRVAINEVENPISQLKKFILFRMHKLKTLTNFYTALKSDHLAHFEFIEDIRKEYDQDEIELVKEILKTGVEKGKFVIDDSDLAAVALVTAMKGLEIPLFINKKHGRIEDRLENLIQFLFYGLIKR